MIDYSFYLQKDFIIQEKHHIRLRRVARLVLLWKLLLIPVDFPVLGRIF